MDRNCGNQNTLNNIRYFIQYNIHTTVNKPIGHTAMVLTVGNEGN
jgi:hypothetical protein